LRPSRGPNTHACPCRFFLVIPSTCHSPKIRPAQQPVFPREYESMPVIILVVFRFVRLLFSGHQAVAVENVALRLQLAAFKRKRKRPVLTQWDRLFWAGISRLWSSWRDALVFVQPETVIRWQRERFRKFWARLSQPMRGRQGRPAIAAEIRQLILRMASSRPASTPANRRIGSPA